MTARPLAAAFFLAALGLTASPAGAKEPLSIYVPTVDYPDGIRPDGAEHRVAVRYALALNGRVAECTVVRSSGLAALDAETCHILVTRARIRPDPDQVRGQFVFVWLGQDSASDPPPARGEPLPYDLARRITYLDYPPEARGQSGTVSYAVTVGPNGLPVRCAITHTSGVEALDRRTCDIVISRGIYIPSSDGGGPVIGVAHGRIRWVAPR